MPSARLAVFWSPEAEKDLLEIWSYLADQASPPIADTQLNAIEGACAKLEHWPHSGRQRDNLLPGLRSVVAFPYVIFYRVRDERVEVVRVLHGRRDIDTIFAGSSDG
jgi:toxin ParE1/3/4